MSRTLSDIEIRQMRIRRNRIRRERQLRRRLVAACSALIIIIVSSLGYTSILSRASESREDDRIKVYSSVVIPYGSSLSEMSSLYIDPEYYDSLDSYMKEVRFINHMSDDSVTAGHYLIVPRYIDAE